MPCKSPHGISKGVGLPSPAISGGSKVSQEPDLVFLMCSQASKMLPDAAKVDPRFHQDHCKSFGDVHRCSTDAPKMVSAPNISRSLFINGGVWGAEPPQDSILYEYKIDMQMRNKKCP